MRQHILYVETSIRPLHLFTLKVHHDYIIKTLKLPINRYPKTLAHKTIESNTYWLNYTKEMFAKYNINMD